VPANKGQRYAADPPTVEEIVAVMRYASHARYGNRLDGLIVVLWRAGLRINEALSLTETHLEQRLGSIVVRAGKGGRRREVGMDAWGWSALGGWLAELADLPIGPLFCVIAGPTRGLPGQCGPAAAAPARPRGRCPQALCPSSASTCALSSCSTRASRYP
jgi:integrase